MKRKDKTERPEVPEERPGKPYSTARRKAAYHLRAITVSAVMTALAVVLERLLGINTPIVKISFAFVPIVLVAILYGSAYAAIVGGLTDFIGALLLPFGPYFPGYTVTATLVGFCFGMFLYRADEQFAEVSSGSALRNRVRTFFHISRPWKLWLRVVIPVLFNNLVIGLLIDTYWIFRYSTTGKGYAALLLSRLLTKYLILIPVELLLIPVLLRVCRSIRSKIRF